MSSGEPSLDLDFGPTLRGFTAGQRLFDRYALREILGRGGMGVVWSAYDEQLECNVALKFLPELVAFDEQSVADLKRETRKTRELRHHHIVQVYDFVTDKCSACISMEYVNGPTLSAVKARKENGCLEVEEIASWVRQLCEALSYAHERAKIVHRDLKPANLMIDGNDELKVTDFGIARSVSDSVSMLTRARGTSGTLVYMSPQQLDGERTSHLDDIYSLGATLFELLASRPPFYSGGIEHQIHDKTPPSLRQRREQLNLSTDRVIPTRWEQTIAACLAKNPSQRPQSAGEVAYRLGLTGEVTFAATKKPEHPETACESLEAPLAKRKGKLATAFATLLAIGVVAGGWFRIQQHRRELERTQLTAAQIEGQQRSDEEARQRDIAEQKRVTEERKAEADAAAEQERLAAQQRIKEEEAKKKAKSPNEITRAPNAKEEQSRKSNSSSDQEEKVLVLNSLLAFNKAVQRKSFAQFYKERLAPQFQQQFSLEKFTTIFQAFIDKGYDISSIAKSEAVFDTPPAIDKDGLLVLKGHYATKPNKVTFKLTYIHESSAWMIMGINVEVIPFVENTGRVPTNNEINKLALDSLLLFNAAIQTKSFDNFHVKIAKLWQQQVTPEKLLQIFHSFIDKRINIALIVKEEPDFDETPSVNGDGLLVLKGSYPTQPNKVFFELKYIFEDESWKLVGINVQVKPSQ
jgi:serine/threonine protein kinase